MKRIALFLMSIALLWRTPSAAQTFLPESPWEMAVATERWLVDGAGARFLPGMEDPARDGDSFVFVDETWPRKPCNILAAHNRVYVRSGLSS